MKKVIYIIVSLMLAVTASSVSSQAYAARPSKETKTVIFSTPLHCQKCVKKVEENISFEKGVRDLEVSLEKKTVKVTYDPSKTDEKKLQEAIEKLGYKPTKIE